MKVCGSVVRVQKRGLVSWHRLDVGGVHWGAHLMPSKRGVTSHLVWLMVSWRPQGHDFQSEVCV